MGAGTRFTVRPLAHGPSAAGARYLRIAEAEDLAANAFAAVSARWRATTPASALAGPCAAFARALAVNRAALARARWPASVAEPIARLILTTRALQGTVRAAPRIPPAGRPAWLRAFTREGLALTATARTIRRRLNIPVIGIAGV